MPVRKSVVVWVVGSVMCAGWLAGCGSKEHGPIDTAKLFEVKSTFGSDFRVTNKGPAEISTKLLGPQELPNGVTFDPPDCRDYVANIGRLPKGTRGKMSVLAADGAGNRLVAMAMQADQDLPYDAQEADNCKHVSFDVGNGKVTSYIDQVDAPEIKGAETAGTHRQIEISVGDQQQSRDSYTYMAYLGDWVVLVTANPLTAKGQPPGPIDTDRARQLLTDSVSALRG